MQTKVKISQTQNKMTVYMHLIDGKKTQIGFISVAVVYWSWNSNFFPSFNTQNVRVLLTCHTTIGTI
jgi:hypothetical protein